jgi:preprotein translocase subunit SecG
MSLAISIALIIAALVMIVTVLLQSSDESGISALSGQSNSYFSKSKAKTFEARLALVTKIAAAAFVVLAILKLIVK